MATVLGRLASHKSTGAVTQAVYQVPSGKVGKVNVTVINNSGTTANVILFISPTSTPAADYVIQHDTISISTIGYERIGLIMKPTEWLCYKTDVAGVNVTVNGIEEDSASDCISIPTLITTNTDTTIFPNSAAKATTVNLTCSIPEGSASDSVSVEMYVTTTNVAGGYIIQKETLRRNGTTGFSREGLALSSTDKLIIRTSSIVGQLAVRVDGFTRG